MLNIKGYIKVSKSAIPNTAKAENILPSTIEETLMGEVNNNWSVFLFFSSEYTLIVKMGIISTRRLTILRKT